MFNKRFHQGHRTAHGGGEIYIRGSTWDIGELMVLERSIRDCTLDKGGTVTAKHIEKTLLQDYDFSQNFFCLKDF
jgi:hypothetical protein